uniref:MRP-S23 domain-containing protein n=1 Tax=Heterorhabditis bacteriophora TaxID=37862 RepID=A0A1I7X044_HETBA
MFLTRALRGNLNRRHWDRRVWEIGYRGPLLPKQKAFVYFNQTGRPDLPVAPNHVKVLRERLQREFEVMKLLTKPYISADVEKEYFTSLNVSGLDDKRQKENDKLDAQRMPGKAKRTEGSKQAVRRRANIGNLLHSHITVEESLASLINRNRWD